MITEGLLASMQDEYKDLIIKNFANLIGIIDPDVTFWAYLLQYGILTEDKKEELTVS